MTIRLRSTADAILPDYELVPLADIRLSEIDQWNSLYDRLGDQTSPFLSFDFVSAVEAERGDVQVLLIRRGGELVTLMPLQVDSSGAAQAAGYPYADRQGWLGEATDLSRLDSALKRFGLKQLEFRYAPESSSWMNKLAILREPNPRIQLPFTHPCPKEKRKWKRLERAEGTVRFEADCHDPEVFELLVQWKRQQCLRTGFGDLFAPQWIRQLLPQLQGFDSERCRGRLSALYVDDRPIAAHFGLYSQHVAHAWFPAFDRQFERYSPGLLLWVELIREASRRGVTWFDFGAGDEAFKYRWATEVPKLNAGIWSSGWNGALPKARLFGKRYSHLLAYRSLRAMVRSYRKVRWTHACRQLELDAAQAKSCVSETESRDRSSLAHSNSTAKEPSRSAGSGSWESQSARLVSPPKSQQNITLLGCQSQKPSA